MTTELCGDRRCAKIRRIVVKLLDSSVRSREHFELRASLAQAAAEQRWYDVDGLPCDAIEDVAADVCGGHAEPQTWPLVAGSLLDWRDPATKAEDERSRDDHDAWRCPDHGRTVEPVFLSGIAYCPADGCSSPLLQIGSAS